ncbi:hypothetical protein VTK73DRAFT_3739 [Phialemonium thermophilum]|uniref:UBR-type domain-containing protein n=1 Tax=Phialemonium thermophilum TaxID=223376 RepID=A0ABR3XZQ9_9PEZI
MEPSADNGSSGQHRKARTESFSQKSDDSQTAADFIRNQMQLEADAREALPYSIENCTKPLGALRQSVFACLTCNPPPADPKEPYKSPAGVCYSCSVQCHGEHNLVEIFNKRNFTCDCGTRRFPDTSPCSLRINPASNTKGGVHSEEPDPNNKYNQNFRNRFCGCQCDYDPFQQKGTMFQCLGLGTHEDGGCGEDWWHPGCIVGLGPKWVEEMSATVSDKVEPSKNTTKGLPPVSVEDDAAGGDAAFDQNSDDEDPPPPPGFPREDEFEGFICYKCVDAFPWIKRYAGAPGFLPPVFLRQAESGNESQVAKTDVEQASKKRKAEDAETDTHETKRHRSDEVPGRASDLLNDTMPAPGTDSVCKFAKLPPFPDGRFSLFFREGFRENICRCASCFPHLLPHPQLLEEEETYEPPVSEEGSENGGSTHGSGSLLDRGENALRNIDRVRAIEGVMAYNHLKDKLKPFFQQFAESGQAISAEDIKGYFAKLRGDEQAIKDAGEAARSDFRPEQSGY